MPARVLVRQLHVAVAIAAPPDPDVGPATLLDVAVVGTFGAELPQLVSARPIAITANASTGRVMVKRFVIRCSTRTDGRRQHFGVGPAFGRTARWSGWSRTRTAPNRN